MTQFIYTDLMVNEDQEEIIDKSIPARHHAQFISQQIADEGRLNTHEFSVSEEEYSNLIKHHKIATVEYTNISNKESKAFFMPEGLKKHDIYIIEK